MRAARPPMLNRAYSDIIDAVREVEQHIDEVNRRQLRIGDLLLKHCGEPGLHGLHSAVPSGLAGSQNRAGTQI
jgi:hypothetical protein